MLLLRRKFSITFFALLVIALLSSMPILADQATVPTDMIDVSASSQSSTYRANLALDGNEDTYWESRKGIPQSITLEFVRPLNITDFSYTPKAGENVIGEYELAVSVDGEAFEKIAEGSWDTTIRSAQTITVETEQPIIAIQLTALSSSDEAVAVAELSVNSSDTDLIGSFSQLYTTVTESNEVLNATRVGYGGTQISSEKAAFEASIHEANSLLEDQNATKQQYDEHYTTLSSMKSEITSEVKNSHLAYLQDMIDVAKGIDPTSDQIDDLMAATDHAVAISGNSAATLDEIDAAISQLVEAIVEADADQQWIGAWATALTAPGSGDSDGFGDSTIRQIIYPTADGEFVRFLFSNEFGSRPLTFDQVGVAEVVEGAETEPGTHREVTFSGKRSVTIPVGETVWSDPIEFDVIDGQPLAISTFVSEPTGPTTWHMRSMQTSYVAPLGNYTETAEAAPFRMQKNSWYWLSSVDVVTGNQDSRVIVALGDSITDGAGGTVNTNNRWPDHLNELLKETYPDANIAVLNAGISANRVLGGSSGVQGESAITRLERDVLSRTGVTDIILFEGINDIGNADGLTAEALIEGYEKIIRAAHERGIRVIGATLTPFNGFDSSYYSSRKDQTRQAVNEWIRTTDLLHGFIDFDKLLEDPDNLTVMLSEYNSGDFLHPGDQGYIAMGRNVDPALFDPAISFELPNAEVDQPVEVEEPIEQPGGEPGEEPADTEEPAPAPEEPSEEPATPEEPADDNIELDQQPAVPDMPKTGMGGTSQQQSNMMMTLLICLTIIASAGGWLLFKKRKI